MLDQPEREVLARLMLEDVISATNRVGCTTELLSTNPFEAGGAFTIVLDLGLNEALNTYLAERSEPVLIIMSDIPLADPEAVRRVIETSADCAIVPGRGGGTNVIFIREPRRFHVDFYGASFLDHMEIARKAGLEVEVIDSYRLSTDVDEKEDLVEVLIHGTGRSREYLERLGLSISIEKGRVGVHRDTHKETL